jgi:hypothetical protein
MAHVLKVKELSREKEGAPSERILLYCEQLKIQIAVLS